MSGIRWDVNALDCVPRKRFRQSMETYSVFTRHTIGTEVGPQSLPQPQQAFNNVFKVIADNYRKKRMRRHGSDIIFNLSDVQLSDEASSLSSQDLEQENDQFLTSTPQMARRVDPNEAMSGSAKRALMHLPNIHINNSNSNDSIGVIGVTHKKITPKLVIEKPLLKTSSAKKNKTSTSGSNKKQIIEDKTNISVKDIPRTQTKQSVNKSTISLNSLNDRSVMTNHRKSILPAYLERTIMDASPYASPFTPNTIVKKQKRRPRNTTFFGDTTSLCRSFKSTTTQTNDSIQEKTNICNQTYSISQSVDSDPQIDGNTDQVSSQNHILEEVNRQELRQSQQLKQDIDSHVDVEEDSEPEDDNADQVLSQNEILEEVNGQELRQSQELKEDIDSHIDVEEDSEPEEDVNTDQVLSQNEILEEVNGQELRQSKELEEDIDSHIDMEEDVDSHIDVEEDVDSHIDVEENSEPEEEDNTDQVLSQNEILEEVNEQELRQSQELEEHIDAEEDIDSHIDAEEDIDSHIDAEEDIDSHIDAEEDIDSHIDVEEDSEPEEEDNTDHVLSQNEILEEVNGQELRQSQELEEDIDSHIDVEEDSEPEDEDNTGEDLSQNEILEGVTQQNLRQSQLLEEDFVSHIDVEEDFEPEKDVNTNEVSSQNEFLEFDEQLRKSQKLEAIDSQIEVEEDFEPEKDDSLNENDVQLNKTLQLIRVQYESDKESNGLRRSKRCRVPRLEYWRGQRPVYIRDSTGITDKIVAINKGSVDSTRNRVKQNKRKRPLISDESDAKHDKIPKNLLDLSIHNKDLMGILKKNKENKTQNNNHIKFINDYDWKKSEKNVGVETAIICKNRDKGEALGVLKLGPKAVKDKSKTGDYVTHLMVTHGALVLQIEDNPEVLIKTGSYFQIDKKTNYSLENSRNDCAYLSFTVLKD